MYMYVLVRKCASVQQLLMAGRCCIAIQVRYIQSRLYCISFGIIIREETGIGNALSHCTVVHSVYRDCIDYSTILNFHFQFQHQGEDHHQSSMYNQGSP